MRNKAAIWLLVAAGLLLVAGANTHLVYVAVTSQPECVVHLRAGEGDRLRGSFSAAQSACSPLGQGRGATDPE
jgi:hypothetical protein